MALNLAATIQKRGTAGGTTCGDAGALGLQDSWRYNWGMSPDGHATRCTTPRAAEFAPMFWSCGANCTDLPAGYRDAWRAAGVKYLLGFNEPDNKGQANMSPKESAQKWSQLQGVAASFDPPLELVSPGMTHWGGEACRDNTGLDPALLSADQLTHCDSGWDWLDQFFGNCTAIAGCEPGLIKYVAVHDYSGDAQGIIDKADAAVKRCAKREPNPQSPVRRCATGCPSRAEQDDDSLRPATGTPAARSG